MLENIYDIDTRKARGKSVGPSTAAELCAIVQAAQVPESTGYRAQREEFDAQEAAKKAQRRIAARKERIFREQAAVVVAAPLPVRPKATKQLASKARFKPTKTPPMKSAVFPAIRPPPTIPSTAVGKKLELGPKFVPQPQAVIDLIPDTESEHFEVETPKNYNFQSQKREEAAPRKRAKKRGFDETAAKKREARAVDKERARLKANVKDIESSEVYILQQLELFKTKREVKSLSFPKIQKLIMC